MPRGIFLTFRCKGYPDNSWLHIMHFSFIGKEDAKREFLLHSRCKGHTHTLSKKMFWHHEENIQGAYWQNENPYCDSP
jgi:hypothetical protein